MNQIAYSIIAYNMIVQPGPVNPSSSYSASTNERILVFSGKCRINSQQYEIVSK